jgi:hypothetical protein
MKPLTEKQLWTIGSLAALSPMLRVVPETNLRAAGNAGWLSGLAALPMLALYALLLRAALRRRRAGEELEDRLFVPLRRFLGLWALVYAGFGLRMSAERFFTALGVFTAWQPFALILAVLAAIAAGWGAKPLGRAAQIFLAAVTAALLLALGCAVPQMDWGRLGGVSRFDLAPILCGALPTASVGMTALGFLALLAPPGVGEDCRRGGAFLLRFTLTSAAISMAAVGVLGAALASRLSHPFFILLRNVSLSHAIERIEALISAVWVLPDLAMLAALLMLARRLLPVRKKPLPAWTFAAAALVIAAVLSPTAFGLAVWSVRIIPIIGAGMAAVIPAAAMTKKR